MPTHLTCVGYSCLCCCESCDGYAIRAAAYIVEADLVAEFYGSGIAAVLTADTAVKIGTNGLTFLDGDLHELAYAALVELSEGIVLEDLCLALCVEELAGVIT